VLDLTAAGGTVPFIARYRRERTGNLSETAIRETLAAKEQWDRLVARQEIILESIARHATLTPELREKIRGTFDPSVLEDLYQPYRQKKRSRADAAREAGLGPLADWIWACGHGTEAPQEGQTLELWAFTFRDSEKGVPDAKTAIEGARDILVERLADDADLRAVARRAYVEGGWLRATRTEKAKPRSRFESYFAFQEKISSLREPAGSHRYLAMRRGQSEGELLLSVTGPPDDPDFETRLVATFEAAAATVPDSPGTEVLQQAARIAFKGLVRSAMENEAHRLLKEDADTAAARVFAENVRRMLLEAPLGPKPVLGVNPARAGARLAVIDARGDVLAGMSLPLETDEEKAAAAKTIVSLVQEKGVEAVAIGNGTAGRDTELFARRVLRGAGLEVPVVLVNEGGVSAHGARDAARAEFPDLEAAVRGAVSIARRLQDPLAELVRMGPRSLGVGQHQHDVTPTVLHRALDAAVESCVHAVGVNLNTASRYLLARVSGIGPSLAGAIVEHREGHGPFRSRQQLLEVPGLEERAFEQAAGFLRVSGGDHPLDDTGIHPERYGALAALAARSGRAVGELVGPGAALVRDDPTLREELGPWTFEDVVHELESPGSDPRGTFVPFSFREDVQKLDDLRPGMVCPGIVSNVTSFGAFVDVGVSVDGLVHVSQIGRRLATDPREAIHPGERVEVRVIKVDAEKRQISLSMKPVPRERRRPSSAASRPQGARRSSVAGEGESARPAAPSRSTAPPRAKGSGPRGTGPSGKRPSPPHPASRRPAFNNPFAVLADLKVGKRGVRS
jgi:protein Tex